ncbi:MAG: lectin [Cyclobacteriaceae bacterium]|nr:lectin [Cyclobacteriaceae bacterium]
MHLSKPIYSLGLCLITFLCSQEAKGQFVTLGHARPMDNGCILLTEDMPYSEGIAYSSQMLNLMFDFEISFDIYLGDKDEMGADGITFVIHKDPRGFQAYGTYGECLGYGRWDPFSNWGTYIAPSIAIEFDTYQNPRQNDPPSDHVAYLENGVNLHVDYWNNDDPDYNLEDGRLHQFQFQWKADIQKITVYLDGYKVYEGQRDLIKDIFKGDPMVIWGFTASTGRKYNLQYFCLKRLAVDYNLNHSQSLEAYRHW